MKAFRWRIFWCVAPVLVSALVVGIASWNSLAKADASKPQGMTFKPGVDLAGGTILVYEVDVAKFKDGKLAGVIDFEMSSTERLTWELAVCLNAWCWEPSAIQKGGPAGHFEPGKTRAFASAIAAWINSCKRAAWWKPASAA